MKSKSLLIIAIIICANISIWAQSNPAAFNLSSANYSFTSWDPASPAGTYPNNMIFHVDSTREAAVFHAVTNYNCPYNMTARARINGRNNQGISFLNTSASVNDQCGSLSSVPTTIKKYMGATVLALNTLGRELIQVSWKGRMMSGPAYNADTLAGTIQTRVYEIKLQYRPDSTSSFIDVPGAVAFSSNINDTTYRNVGDSLVLPTVTLPGICNNKTYVQVRWVYYQSVGGSGVRPELGLDDINVSSSIGSNFTATISAGGPTDFCQGNSVVLSCTDAASYLWSTGETTQSITVSNSGSYFVTATNANGTSAVSNSIQVNISLAPNAVISFTGASAICDGASTELCANLGTSYLWNTSETTPCITVTQPGPYSVVVVYANGCTSLSNPVEIFTATSPNVPTITYTGGVSLFCDLATTYQWYLNGVLIDGATGQYYDPIVDGTYTVLIGNELGCTATSLPYEWLITGTKNLTVNSMNIYPIPASNSLNISWQNHKLNSVEIFNVLGEAQKIDFSNLNTLNIQSLSSGTYFIKVVDNFGNMQSRFFSKQ